MKPIIIHQIIFIHKVSHVFTDSSVAIIKRIFTNSTEHNIIAV